MENCKVEGIQKGMTLQAVCESCGKRTMLSTEVNVTTGKRFMCIENNTYVVLAYWKCECCEKIHFVQIDDEMTLDLLNECKRNLNKLIMIKKSGKAIPEKTIKKIKSKNKLLDLRRNKMMKEYTNCSFVSLDGDMKIDKIQFSV